MEGYGTLIIWVLIIGGTFLFLWRKGHLGRLTRFVAETREELRKCNWPTWTELKGSTVVVMIAIFLLGIYVMGVDFVILRLVRGVLPEL